MVLEHMGPKRGQHFINVKNVLYFFPQMESPIDPRFRKTFLERLPELVMIDWLKGLYAKNQGYQALLEQGIFSEEEFSGGKVNPKGLQLPIKLVPGTVTKLYDKLLKIQSYLLEHPEATHADLLRYIEPILARYYAKVQEDVMCTERPASVADAIMACIRALYLETAPTVEEEVNLRSQIRTNTAVMTELVMQTAEQFGFEEGRSEPLEKVTKEFLFALDYSRFDERSIALLYEGMEGFGFIGFDYRDVDAFLEAAFYHQVNNPSLYDYLMSKGPDINRVYFGGDTLLHMCAKCKQAKVAEDILRRGLSVHVTNGMGYTALHIAASCNDVAMIDVLVRHGIKLGAQEKRGETALDKALNRGHTEAAIALIGHGSQMVLEKHRVNLEAFTLLETTFYHSIDNPSPYDYLISKGLDINKVYPGGDTLLHICAKCKQAKIADDLLRRGLNVQETNSLGYTALDIAVSCNDLVMIDVLIRHGIKLDDPENPGKAALNKAFTLGHMDAARALVRHGSLVVLEKYKASLEALQAELSSPAKSEPSARRPLPQAPAVGRRPLPLLLLAVPGSPVGQRMGPRVSQQMGEGTAQARPINPGIVPFRKRAMPLRPASVRISSRETAAALGPAAPAWLPEPARRQVVGRRPPASRLPLSMRARGPAPVRSTLAPPGARTSGSGFFATHRASTEIPDDLSLAATTHASEVTAPSNETRTTHLQPNIR